MAFKTISLDLEAYERLSRAKKPGQSFSEVVKEHFAPPKVGRDLLAALDRVALSEATLEAVEQQIRAR